MRPRTIIDNEGRVHRSKVITGTPCGKNGYASRKLAASAAAASRRHTGDDIHAYRCSACHCFHIGHRPWWARR